MVLRVNFNRQSEAVARTDQADTHHAYTRDKLDRVLLDAVTFPSGTKLTRRWPMPASP